MKEKNVGEIIKEIAPIKPRCNENCKKKCSEKIIDQDREEIFCKFYESGDINVQWLYIIKN